MSGVPNSCRDHQTFCTFQLCTPRWTNMADTLRELASCWCQSGADLSRCPRNSSHTYPNTTRIIFIVEYILKSSRSGQVDGNVEEKLSDGGDIFGLPVSVGLGDVCRRQGRNKNCWGIGWGLTYPFAGVEVGGVDGIVCDAGMGAVVVAEIYLVTVCVGFGGVNLQGSSP